MNAKDIGSNIMGLFKKNKKKSKANGSGSKWISETVNCGTTPCIMRIVNRAEETWQVVEPTNSNFPSNLTEASEYAVNTLVNSNSVSRDFVNSHHVRVGVRTNIAGQREFFVEFCNTPL